MFLKVFSDFVLFLTDFIECPSCRAQWLWGGGNYRRAQLLTVGRRGIVHMKG